MDEREKAELNKQKKLVDCVANLNYILAAFKRLEDYQAKVLPIIDGFDLIHADTYLELTKYLKRELFYIKLFSSNAADELVKYSRLCNPDVDIYSVKEKKYGLQPLKSNKKEVEEMQHTLKETQKKADDMLYKQKKGKINQIEIKTLEDIKNKLDAVSKNKRQEQNQIDEKIVKIESRLSRLEWAIFLVFFWQIGVFIKNIW